jgi:RNA polymerase sigma-70 factor (ECF subfamily)
MKTEETILVRRLQAREPAALGELYDRHGTAVHRLALRMVRNAPAAEDLTQETFLSIWNGIATFDPARGSLASWVAVVARSRVIDHLRTAEFRASLRKAPVEEAQRWEAAASTPAGLLLAGPWRKLKRREQVVLRLAHWSGLSQSEIAERLHRPLGTVKSWMRSGHQSLRAALEG